MKSQALSSNVIDTNLEVKSSKVEIGAKIFEILSDGIYSDKILAILRELSCNAIDAHIEAGNTESFDIKLPTLFDNTFFIRDYGTGLDKNFLEDVYFNYGISTKDGSNDYIGSWGIGACSVLCYHKKQSTLDSWKDGVHLKYEFFINEEGCPSYVKLVEEESNEPNGIKIEIQAKDWDYPEFERKALYLASYAKIKPRFLDSDIKPTEQEYVIEKNEWGIRRENHGGLRVIMGGVPYNVQYGSFPEVDYEFVSAPIDIHVNIGEVNIDASRENITSDKKSNLILEKFYNRIISGYKQELTDLVNEERNLWRARIKFGELKKSIPRFVKIDGKDILYCGTQLCENKNKIDVDGIQIKSLKNVNSVKTEHVREIYFREKTIVCNDLKSGCYIRCHNYRDTVDNNASFLIFKEQDKEDFKNLLGCDDEDIILASSLSEPPKKSNYVKRKTSFGYKYDPSEVRVTYAWMPEEVDLDVGGYYTVLDRFTPVKFGFRNFYKAVKIYLANCGNVTIYGFNKTNSLKLNNKWILIDDILKKTAIDKFKSLSEETLKKAQDISSIYKEDYEKLSNITGVCSEISKFNDEYSKVLEIKKEHEDYYPMKYLIESLGGKTTNKKRKLPNIDKTINSIYRKYPILKVTDEYTVSTNIEIFKSYVRKEKNGNG